MDNRDRNPYLWRFVNAGTDWWRKLVNRTSTADGAPLFTPPEIAGDKLELVPSVQPVLPIDGHQLEADPTVSAIIIQAVRVAVGPIVGGTLSIIPLYSSTKVRTFIRDNFQTENLGTHTLGRILDLQIAAVKRADIDDFEFRKLDAYKSAMYFQPDYGVDDAATDTRYRFNSHNNQDPSDSAVSILDFPHGVYPIGSPLARIGPIHTYRSIPQARIWTAPNALVDGDEMIIVNGMYVVYPQIGTIPSDLLTYLRP